MPTYKRSAVTSKKGINFVRSVVEAASSLFIKIEQENDLGIDALFEFIRDERPLNKQIAVQIKSGASYYNAETEMCAFPIGDHRSYWSSHSLPVFGIVYVPSKQAAYWLNIKRYLETNVDAATIRFPATQANLFAAGTFTTLFVPEVLGEVPHLSHCDALSLADSQRPPEMYLGLLVLFRRYPNDRALWARLISLFRSLPVCDIPPIWIDWLAHIPWHGDIFYCGEALNEDTKAYVRDMFAQFECTEVVKLLEMIDPEDHVGRGTVGQSVEAIISSLPRAAKLLRQVISATGAPMSVRESAALILAMKEGSAALCELQLLHNADSWYAGEVFAYVKEYGGINPYA